MDITKLNRGNPKVPFDNKSKKGYQNNNNRYFKGTNSYFSILNKLGTKWIDKPFFSKRSNIYFFESSLYLYLKIITKVPLKTISLNFM